MSLAPLDSESISMTKCSDDCRSPMEDMGEAADKISSPENYGQVAAWPRRKRLIFVSVTLWC